MVLILWAFFLSGASFEGSKDFLLSKGFYFYYKKDLERARWYFEKYLESYPPDPVIYRYLGEIFLQQGDNLSAISILKEGIQHFPKNTDLYILLGRTYVKEKKLKEAIQAFEKALKEDPYHIEALLSIASLSSLLQQKEEALRAYRRLILAVYRKGASREYLQMAYLYMGRYYMQKREYEKAISYFKKLKEIGFKEEANYYLLELYQYTGRLKKALQIAKSIYAKNPSYKRAVEILAELSYALDHRASAKFYLSRYLSQKPDPFYKALLLELNGEKDFAREFLEKNYKKFQVRIAFHKALENIYRSLGRKDLLLKEVFWLAYLFKELKAYPYALIYSQEVLSLLSPSSNPRDLLEAFLLHAGILENLGSFQTALFYLQKAEEIALSLQDPDKIFYVYVNLIWIALQQEKKDFALAQKYLDKVKKEFPKESRGYFLEGLYFFYQEKYKKALSSFQKAISMVSQKKRKSSYYANYYFYLGVTAEKLGDLPLMISSLEKALEIRPEESSFLNYLGYTLSLKGIQLEYAEELLRKALEIDPENPAYIDSLGWIFFKKKQYKKALEKLLLAKRILQERNEEDPVVYFHLAEVYYALGKYYYAYFFYQKALHLKDKATEEMDISYIKKKMEESRRLAQKTS